MKTTTPTALPAEKKELKLGFETTGSWLSGSDQFPA